MILKTRDNKAIAQMLPLLQEAVAEEGLYTLQEFLKWYRNSISTPFCHTWIEQDEEKEVIGFCIAIINQNLKEEYINILYNVGDFLETVEKFAKQNGIPKIVRIVKTPELDGFQLLHYTFQKEVQ